MPKKGNVQFIPQIDNRLLARLRSPNSWLLNSSQDTIAKLNELVNALPVTYKWHFRTADAFKKTVEGFTPDSAAKQSFELFWMDALRQIEAFSVTTSYRISELAQTTVRAINRNDILCAAILARAALETTANYAWFQIELRRQLTAMSESKLPYPPGLEALLVKYIFASRQDEDIYSPTNIVTIIQKTAKQIPHQQEIEKIYGVLCEVAHPNRLGRSIYISSAQNMAIEGEQILTISKVRGPSGDGILFNSISALSWACGGFVLSFAVVRDAIAHMLEGVKRLSENPK